MSKLHNTHIDHNTITLLQYLGAATSEKREAGRRHLMIDDRPSPPS